MFNEKNVRARAPAKLILSGEHAVVYGRPAIAMAVDRFAETSLFSAPSPTILFNLLSLSYTKTLTVQALRHLKHRVQNKYHKFLNGECTIREVLHRPFELMQYAFTHFIDKLNVQLPQGVEVHTRSTIPIGCGMGSSAASVVSVLHAISHFFELNMPPENYISLSRDAENLQHGYSSGLDVHLAVHGGCVYFKEGHASHRAMPEFPMYLVHTGVPETTTGECVTAVESKFKNDRMGDAFERVTEAMDAALQSKRLVDVQQCVRENHRLLLRLGVVPQKVQGFVADLEKLGAAAKICGAGATVGEGAGMVLAIADPALETEINGASQRYGYEMFPVRGDTCGIRTV